MTKEEELKKFWLAIKKNHINKVQSFLDSAIDFNYEDKAIRMACATGHVEIVKLLMDKGANVHTDEDFPLRVAIMNGNIEVINYLLDNHFKIPKNHIDYTFKWCQSSGRIQVLKILLERKALPKKYAKEIILELNEINKCKDIQDLYNKNIITLSLLSSLKNKLNSELIDWINKEKLYQKLELQLSNKKSKKQSKI